MQMEKWLRGTPYVVVSLDYCCHYTRTTVATTGIYIQRLKASDVSKLQFVRKASGSPVALVRSCGATRPMSTIQTVEWFLQRKVRST